VSSLIDFSKYKKMESQTYYRTRGKVVNIIGLTIESAGPDAKLGDICLIYPKSKDEDSPAQVSGKPTMAEVVGFKDDHVQLMPYENTNGIGCGSIVENTEAPLRVNVGEGLLGKTLDGLGRIDGINYGQGMQLEDGISYSIENQPPDPMTRDPISDVLPLGVKAVDGLLTVGKGQRIGIFAGSGVGKSTLLGMFARNTKADINVIALIGERGREVREFIERDLGPEGMSRSVVVVATSDKPALERVKAAKTATSVAEYFRDQGKDVLLMMDSLTRFSMAQREIGLASGEPPVSRGYPPSVYAEMPKLLERAGRSKSGSITGLYTVLVDGDDFNEPITDTARSILDGHIVLNRKLAQKNHYPAIDVLQSISRCMSSIVGPEQKKASGRLKNVLATYNDVEDLINIGAYKSGANKNIDFAIEKIDQVNEFLMQSTEERYTFEEIVAQLEAIFDVDEKRQAPEEAAETT
jgi:flagellum-specific ATP synthase